MSRRRFSDAASLINDLLDRHERGAGSTRPAASIDNDGFSSVDQRDAFDEALEALEQCGAIDLIRTGPNSERTVTGARLKDAALLYARVGRQPAHQLIAGAMAELRSRRLGQPNVLQLLDDAAAAWSRGVSFIGIARNDVRTLEQVIGLAEAAHDRVPDGAAGEVDFRTFSRLAISDSKALERNLRSVTGAFSRMFQRDGAQSTLEPEEFLGSLGIKRLPQPVLVHGAITLGGERLPALPFIGIPTESVHAVALASTPSYVMTIENYASFIRYVREVARTDGALVIYSGGFPSRPTLDTISRLAAGADVAAYHWGDMDAGGVRIFHHIERRLASVGVELRPHMMEADMLRRVGSPVPDASRATGDVGGSAIAELAELIRETGLVHEQEELGPRSPLEAPHA